MEENLLGLLRVRVIRGINLAVRDVRTSDPYLAVRLGHQKLKTKVIRKNVNPQWNEDLTLTVTDINQPVKVTVYDHDRFSKDDKMGEAEFDLRPFMEALQMNLDDVPTGTIVTRLPPCRQNCLSEESCIFWLHGRIMQKMCLRLRNVERGEVEIELHWISLPYFQPAWAEEGIFVTEDA